MKLHFNWKLALALSGVALMSASSIAKADLTLKPNDRIVFYGDSITDQRLYTTFVETYLVTRYPDLPLTFVHSGWGGDRVTGGGGGPIDLRLQRDVLAYDPTVVTIMLGMNDASYRAFDQGIFDTYANGTNHILDVLKKDAPKARVTLIEPSPFDDVTRAPQFPGGYNGVLLRYSDFVAKTAQQRGLGLSDFNTPVVAMLQKADATNHDLAQKIIPDRIHPSSGGHLVMAEALLKSWGAPALVSDVSIDAATKKVVRAQNTKISDLKLGTGATLSWTQNDNALPFPLDTGDATVDLALQSSDFVQALDQEPLQVTGLTAPAYTLSIDGAEVGDFTRDELSKGINLALLPTPMNAQAQNVLRLTRQHNDEHFNRWRNIQVPYSSHGDAVKAALPPLLKALDAEEAQTVVQQRAAAQPKPHNFELTIAPPKPTGRNVALNKPYTVSDPNNYNYGIGGLTDGLWSGESPHTFATGDKDEFPKTVTIDLQNPTILSQIWIGVPSFGSTKTVRVALGTDGQNFKEIGSTTFALAIERRKRFSFAPQSARYIRLTFPDHYAEERGYNANFAFISEVEAYEPNRD